MSGINILFFFSKLELVYAVSAVFQDQVSFFACLLLEKWIYPWQCQSYMSPEGLEKIFNDFSSSTFLIKTGIINLFDYIWGIWFISKNT